jgi:hypothetical protein
MDRPETFRKQFTILYQNAIGEVSYAVGKAPPFAGFGGRGD